MKSAALYGAFLLAIYNQEEEEFQTVCKAGTGFSDEDMAPASHIKVSIANKTWTCAKSIIPIIVDFVILPLVYSFVYIGLDL